MAKKRKSVELSNKKISFIREKTSYRVIRYYPSEMNVDVMLSDENGKNIGIEKIPFAHIPRETKKLIKPN